ncbi:MAG: phosphotransacetylase family protein [Thermodesulfovibrionales bacterium]|nr:phosphotransacetylase family protein [Thermodesulfovibrionales bacterium]
MTTVYIGSKNSHTGKTFFTIGLGLALIERGIDIGYIKPFGKTLIKKGKDIVDEDALFIKEALNLKEPIPIMSPFVYTFEYQNAIYEGVISNARQKVMDAYNEMKSKQLILIGGGADLFEGTVLDIDGLSIIKETNAKTIIVDTWISELTLDTFVSHKQLLGENFLGAIINKVPANLYNHVKQKAVPFLNSKGITVFGVFKKDKVLEAITVRQLIEVLNGGVLCCEDKLDEFVENFSVGAMDVDTALSYFRKISNKAVITGAHRTDIQLMAMETSTKCIILTGGLFTNDVVIGRAKQKGIPIISVSTDTFTTVEKIEKIMGKTMIREKSKVTRSKEIIDNDFDMDTFLKSIGLS